MRDAAQGGERGRGRARQEDRDLRPAGRLYTHLLGQACAGLCAEHRQAEVEGRERGLVPRHQRRLRDGPLGPRSEGARQDPLPRRRQRGVDPQARPGARSQRARHGHAHEPLLDAGRRRRGEAAQRGGARQVRGVRRGHDAEAAGIDLSPQSAERRQAAAAARAVAPFLLGVAPFGLVTGVAMVAGGIPPLEAMALSMVVYAGASMLAATQLLAGGAPLVVILVTALFINVRFMMYSASIRPHLAALPVRWRLAAGYLLADNAYALSVARFTEHPEMKGKAGYYFGAALTVWLTWQAAVAAGIALGAGLPAAWRLEFAAPLAFIALTVPLLRERAMVAAALAAAAAAVAGAGLPVRLGLATAALAGLAAGLLVGRRR